MIYLDNAATSKFKPKEAIEALVKDVTDSANSGRSAYKTAIEASTRIEKAREYLLSALDAEDDYNIVFTKNCTEAINLAIFGTLRENARVVTTANEHNSVLRPLFELSKRDKIKLDVIEPRDNGEIAVEDFDKAFSDADFAAISAASNVTGARVDLNKLGEIAQKHGVALLVDGAQAVPVIDIAMKKQKLDMLACPGHKGLHGIQGTGFLIYHKSFNPVPLIYGGTGTSSLSTLQPMEAPEAYEAGTLFSGGIGALHLGAKWSFDNLFNSRRTIRRLAEELCEYLKNMGATVYTRDATAGVVSFNIKNADSAFIAQTLSDNDIAVRSGLHCAPLVHRFLGTQEQGAVRASIGVDNTEKDIYRLIEVLERLLRKL